MFWVLGLCYESVSDIKSAWRGKNERPVIRFPEASKTASTQLSTWFDHWELSEKDINGTSFVLVI
jgi:hypothetical protein